MIKYYINNKKRNFYQTWYFKHQCNNDSISFAPGVIVNKKGEKKAFINIYYENNIINIEYPFSDFKFNDEKIYIGENEFSKDGIKLNINDERIKVNGEIKYSRSVALTKGILSSMRTFNSTNEVISIRQYLNGILNINNNSINFIDGIGYIESIFGKKMSEEKLWVQCCDKYNYSIKLLIEPTNKIGVKYLGCDAIIYCNGREYKLSTIKGCKIITYSNNKIVIKQGKYSLEITFNDEINKNQEIVNNTSVLCGKASIIFKINKKTIFNYNSDKCSYEYSIKKCLTA